MYTKIILTDDEEYMMDKEQNYVKYKFFSDFSVVGVFLHVFDFNSLEEELKKVEMSKFLKEMKKYISTSKINQDSNRFKALNRVSLESINQVITTVDFIELRFKDNNYDRIQNYIKNNRIISNKRIIIEESIKINDYSKIDDLLEQFRGVEDNIYVKLEYSEYNPVSLKECLKTMNSIKEIVDRVNSYNFSQLEKIMYVYDITKNRKYNEEKKSESIGVSRDLVSILNGNKITNEGYCNLFNAILSSLGMKTKNDKLRDVDNKKNHTRMVVHINDEKYNVNGVYFFDPTNDSIKTKYDNLYNYSSFARTKDQIDSRKMIYDFDHKYKNAPTSLGRLLESIDSKKDKNLFQKMDEYNWIIRLCVLTDNENIDISEIDEKTKQKLNKLFSKINKPISNSTMIEVLYNVRHIEHLENNDISFSVEALKLISQISGWKISFNTNKLEEEKFYRFLNEIDRGKKVLNKVR